MVQDTQILLELNAGWEDDKSEVLWLVSGGDFGRRWKK